MALADRQPDVSIGVPAPTDRWQSWTMLSGIVFAVAFVAGMLVGGNTPDYDAPDDEWVRWFDDSGNTALQLVSMFLMVFAAAAFVVFVTGLTRRMREAAPEHAGAAQLTLFAGLILATSLAIGGVAINQMSGAIEFGDLPVPSADVLRAAEQLGYGITLVVGGWFAALTVGAASFAARGSTMVPSWLVNAGFGAAVILIFSVLFLPMIVLPLWVLVTSVFLVRR